MRTQRLVGWLSQPAVWLAGWLGKCLLGRKKSACGSTHRGRKLGFPNSAFLAGKKPRGRKRERKEERNTDRTATATAICTWPQGREAVAGKGGEQDRKCGQPWKARARHSQPPPASHSQQEERRPQPATATHRGGRGHRGTQASFLNSPGIIPKPGSLLNSPAAFLNSPAAFLNSPASFLNSPADFLNSPKGAQKEACGDRKTPQGGQRSSVSKKTV
jgi:hypothetical protein